MTAVAHGSTRTLISRVRVADAMRLGRSSGERAEAGLVWEDLVGMAARNSRPIARYLVFMGAACVSYGVIEHNASR